MEVLVEPEAEGLPMEVDEDCLGVSLVEELEVEAVREVL